MMHYLTFTIMHYPTFTMTQYHTLTIMQPLITENSAQNSKKCINEYPNVETRIRFAVKLSSPSKKSYHGFEIESVPYNRGKELDCYEAKQVPALQRSLVSLRLLSHPSFPCMLIGVLAIICLNAKNEEIPVAIGGAAKG